MLHARDIFRPLGMAASWLLVVAVLLGPAGLDGSAAFGGVSSTACGTSCPCDEAVHGGHDRAHEPQATADPRHDDGAHAAHDDGEPCGDECPDDCPSCGCCMGIAVLPLPVTSGAASWASARMLSDLDAPANGACTGVFRPPRSLT